MYSKEDSAMQWIDPAYCDIRLGFEVTAYVYVR
ncbi:MAG: pyrroloquinoline quinone precursor peptide PqqA [Rhodocyclaceae bacterium]|nr:pyrroloquinoline quinone precursor peptide PqqA [Rhodocyclaceae bacterium]